MKDHKDKLSSSAGVSVDERLGNVLSAGLHEADTGEITQCLDAEAIAGLVDRELPADSDERDKIMKHLSSCDTCYEVYMLAANLVGDEERKKEKSNVIRFRIKPLALAATILIAVVAMYLFFKVEEIPKTPDQLVKMSESKKEVSFGQPVTAAPQEKKLAAEDEEAARTDSDSAPPPTPFFDKKARAKDKVKAEALEKGGKGSYEAEREKRLPAAQPKKHVAKPGKKKGVLMEEKADIPGERREKRGEKEADDARVRHLQTTAAKPYGPKRKTGQMARSQTRVAPIPSKSPAETGVETIKQPMGYDSHFHRLNRLSDRLLTYKADIPANELTRLFKETVELTEQLKETFEGLRKEGIKSDYFKPLETRARDTAAVPIVTVVRGEDAVYIYPNMAFFLSKSIAGSMEHRFFSLASQGWCDAKGVCYNGAGRAGIGSESPLKESDIHEKKKRLAKWEALYPSLKGIYREIALHTINHLKKKP